MLERTDGAMDGSAQAQQAAAVAQVQAQAQAQVQAQAHAAAHAAQAQAHAHAQAAAQAQAQVHAQVQAQAQVQAAQAHAQAQADSQTQAQAQAQADLQNGQMAPAPPLNGDPTLYNGEPMGMTPVFAETPAWLTENTPLPPYQRKPSDAITLRLMVEALSSQNPSEARFDEIPADGIVQPGSNTGNNINDTVSATAATASAVASAAAALNVTIPPPHSANPVSSSGNTGTLDTNALKGLFPMPYTKGDTTATSPEGTKDSAPAKRSKMIQPHWTSKPRILVVEDDVVYRQLSSKFLEKFGCVTETVEDAQGAVSKMNNTKYDLVLMDIFFGPSMDG